LLQTEKFLQRLFSNFASGWPGRGMLALRVLTAAALVHSVGTHSGTASGVALALEYIAASLGLFVLVGLWTPIVGILIAAIELWLAIFAATDPWMAIALATLGGSLAMIGPGAWSIDARLFGRKHIATPHN
jgi:putative oxidoreductase